MYLTRLGMCLLAASMISAAAHGTPARNVSIFNCSALKGETPVCLFNETDETITDIDCEGHLWGSRNVGLPKGGIAPHSLTIVNMASCHTQLVFTVLGGAERKSGPINTDEATIIDVPAK